MTEKFEKGWEYVKKNEGGYIDDEDDSGGATKYGISLRFLKGLDIEEGDVNDDNKINEEDIKDLDEEKAKELYYVHFWLPPKCEEINDTRVAIKLFDMCVNFGVGGGAKVIQRAVNSNYDYNKLTVDGKIGKASLSAINTLGYHLMSDIPKNW
ncbi:MAG: hypothetical protein LBB34_00030 [Holosporales bacterium]|jgi:lysozyme family protein|nr:hypothetical protein [Holosporales bacterium]